MSVKKSSILIAGIALLAACVAFILLQPTQSRQSSETMTQMRNLGQTALAEKKWEEAVNHFTRILESAPKDHEALLGRAVGLKELACLPVNEKDMIDHKRATEARKQLATRSLVDLDLLVELDAKQPRYFAMRAEIYRRAMRDDAKALANCKAALELDANFAEAIYQRGAVLTESKDPAGAPKALGDLERAIALLAGDPRPYYTRSVWKHRAGDMAGAISDLNRALEIEVDHRNYLLVTRNQMLFLSGRTEEALAEYTSMTQAQDPFTRILGHEGQFTTYATLMRIDEAIEAVNQALAVDAKLATFLLAQRARFYYSVESRDTLKEDSKGHLRTTYLERAVADCSRYLEAVPEGDAAVFFVRAVCQCKLGRIEASLPDFASSLKLDPESALTYRNRALAHHYLGRRRETLADAEASLRLIPKQGDLRALRAELLAQEGKIETAIADYSLAMELGLRDSAIYLERGNLYLLTRKLDLAMNDYTEALRLDPRCDMAHQGKAMVHVHRGDKEQALAEYEAAARANPNNPQGHIMQSMLSSDPGLAQKARESLEACAPDPKNRSAAWYLHSAGLYVLEKNWERALADTDRALELKPNCLSSRNNRVVCLIALKRHDEAIEFSTKILGDERNDAEAWNRRGTAYMYRAQFEKALHDFNRAIELAPRNPGHYSNRAKVWDALGNADRAAEDRMAARKFEKVEIGSARPDVVNFGIDLVTFNEPPPSVREVDASQLVAPPPIATETTQAPSEPPTLQIEPRTEPLTAPPPLPEPPAPISVPPAPVIQPPK